MSAKPEPAATEHPRSSLADRGRWSGSRCAGASEHFEPSAEHSRAADAAIQGLHDRGSPSHDGVAARLVGYEEDDGRHRDRAAAAALGAAARAGDASHSVAALCVTRSADGRWLAGRRAPWVVLVGRALGAGRGRRGRPRREPGGHARARAARGVVGRRPSACAARRCCGCRTGWSCSSGRRGWPRARSRRDARPRARRVRVVAARDRRRGPPEAGEALPRMARWLGASERRSRARSSRPARRSRG